MIEVSNLAKKTDKKSDNIKNKTLVNHQFARVLA
jgi:hypothetical protein